jgi:hypothetical protein
MRRSSMCEAVICDKCPYEKRCESWNHDLSEPDFPCLKGGGGMKDRLCNNCQKDVEPTGLGECPFCGADLESANSLRKEGRESDLHN